MRANTVWISCVSETFNCNCLTFLVLFRLLYIFQLFSFGNFTCSMIRFEHEGKAWISCVVETFNCNCLQRSGCCHVLIECFAFYVLYFLGFGMRHSCTRIALVKPCVGILCEANCVAEKGMPTMVSTGATFPRRAGYTWTSRRHLPLKQWCQLPSREGIGGSSKSMQNTIRKLVPKKEHLFIWWNFMYDFFEYLALQLQ
jgi:hypothetical protein